MVRVGRDLKDHLVPAPLPLAGTSSTRPGCSELHPTLNTSREGAATASLGNLCQCFTTLTVKNFFLISNLNLPSFSLKLFPLVLSLHTLWKVPLHPSCRPLQVLEGCSKVSQSLHVLCSLQPLSFRHCGPIFIPADAEVIIILLGHPEWFPSVNALVFGLLWRTGNWLLSSYEERRIVWLLSTIHNQIPLIFFCFLDFTKGK